MEGKWKIEFYKPINAKSPLDEFVNSLDVRVQSKIVDVLSLLKEFGIKLGSPHSKRVVGTTLWELRILGSNNIRIFYIAQSGKTFLILHGFQKKKQKTDKKEIKIALDRLSDYKSRTQN